ncbi:MAG: serine hydrolase domain-containing protein, partial [Gemmatimonadota bacterium]
YFSIDTPTIVDLIRTSSCVDPRTMLLRHISPVLAAALLAPLTALTAQSNPPAVSPDVIAPALQRLADSLVASRPRLPGIVIAVRSRALGRSWSVAAGFSDSARKIPLRPEQPMRIASNTKTYVAAALLRLIEAGRLALSDPLTKHLSTPLDQLLRRDGYDTDVITIEQVLSHRAGFNEHPAVPSYAARLRTDPRYRWTREEQLQWLVDSLNPVGPPGGQFRYSDSGYTILGAIIERYANQPVGPAVRRLLGFDTLGLRATWWEVMEPIPEAAAPRAHQYLAGFDSYDIDPSFDLYGGGGIVASMSEVAEFLAALLEGRVFATPATLTTMLAPRSTEMAGYGLGIFGTNVRGLRGVGHSGFWGTSVMGFPEAGVTIAITTTEPSELRVANGVTGSVLALFGAGR